MEKEKTSTDLIVVGCLKVIMYIIAIFVSIGVSVYALRFFGVAI